MDKEKFMKWLETKVNEVLNLETKDDIQKSYILGAATSMNEMLRQANEGYFDKK